MNRKLNVKLLLMLFIGSIAFVVITHFVHGYQVAKNADGLLKRAEIAKESGDLINALKYRRRYLIYRRDDYEQLSKYALDMKVMLEQESGVSALDFRKTYDAIENALRKLKDAEEAEKYRDTEEQLRLASVEFAMGYGLWSAAIDHLDYLIEQQGEDVDPELELKLARCHYVMGNVDEVLRILHQLVGYDEITGTFTQPARALENTDAYSLLAMVYRMKERNAEMAEKVLARMIEANPDSFDAYLKRCSYWRSMGELHKEKARADMEKALELGSDEANVLELAAGIELDDDHLAEAKTILDQAVQTFPDEVRFYRLLAAWAAKSNDYDLARQYVTDGLEKLPGNLDLVWYRANLELENNHVDDAKKSLAEMKKTGSPPAYIDVLDAQIAMAEKRWLDASGLLERVRPDLTEGATNLLSMVDRGLARCYERLGQPDKMLTAYQNLVVADPEDQTVAWGLIRAQLLMGRVESASNTFRRMEEEFQLRGEELSTASLPTLLQLRTAEQLQLPEDQRNWDEANRLILRIQKEPSIAPEDRIKLTVDLYRKRGDTEAANRILQKARQQFGGDLTFRLAEVDQMFRQDGFDAAWRMLDSLQAELGDNLNLRTARARLIAIHRGPEMKQRLLALEKDDDALSPQDRTALRWTLAQFHYGANQRDEARRLFEQIAELNPEDVNVQMTLFELAKEMDQEAEVNSRLAELKRLVGSGGAQYKAAEASRLLWKMRREEIGPESLTRVRSLINDARRSRPNWDRLALLEAEAYLVEKDTDAAVAVLQRASEGAASSKIVKRQLIRLLVSQEQYEQARKVIGTLPEADRLLEEKRMAAVMQGGTGASGQSMAQHVNSTNPDDHLADAQRLARAKNWAEAETALLRAVQTGPGRTNTWLSLVSFLVSQSRYDEAEDIARQAQLQLPESLVPLFAGQCYELIPGNAELALQFYNRAHNINPDDVFALQALASFHLRARKGQPANLQKKHLDQARHYLQELVDVAQRNSSPSPAHAAWARREMARLIAASGRYPDYLEALKLVDQNADAQGNLDAADTLFYAELAAKRRDGSSRQRTIQQLESAQASRTLTNSERVVLAELYAKTKQKWEQCRTIMEAMLADYPDDPQIRLLWVEWLLERNETGEAAKLLAELQPETPRSKALNAKRLVLQGQPDQAVKVLRSLLPEKLPTDKNEARILLEVAALTDELARHDASLYGRAENLYRAFAKRNPAGKLPLAAFLGRRGGESRLQEAFQLCGQAIQEQPPELVVQEALTILREHPGSLAADAKVWGQLEGWIDMAQRRSPNSIVPVLQRASLEEARGQLANAETLYRQLLDRPGLDAFNRAIVANNLAYLLALEQKETEALTLIANAMEQLGPIDDVLDTRAVVHLAGKEPQKAKRDLQAIVSGGSQSPEVHFHLAQAEQMLGATEDARAALQRAIELGLSRGRVKPVERPRLEQLARELGVPLSGNGDGAS